MARTLPAHSLVAFNTATESENKIHDDAVAGKLGFGGGLVPGVDVYAYLCHAPVAEWGADFLTRGWATTRFGTPVYDGERVEVRAEVADEGTLSARIHRPGDTGGPSGPAPAFLEARLDDDQPTPPSVGAARQPAPDDRRPASPESIPTGTVLGTFSWSSSADDQAAYRADVRDGDSPLADLGLVHPGALLRHANTVLSQTVLLGPWIHVGSTVHHYGPVAVDESIEVRGVVTDNREHKGHRFVDLDVVLLGSDGGTRVWVEHTAIYEPRQLRHAVDS